MCNYFAGCANYPNGMVEHPILERVPTCTRCATRMEQELLPFTFEEALRMVEWLEYNDDDTFDKLAEKVAAEGREFVNAAEFYDYMAHVLRNDNEEVLS